MCLALVVSSSASRCFEPSQALRIVSGLKTNLSPPPRYTAHNSVDVNHIFFYDTVRIFYIKKLQTENSLSKQFIQNVLQHTSYLIEHTNVGPPAVDRTLKAYQSISQTQIQPQIVLPNARNLFSCWLSRGFLRVLRFSSLTQSDTQSPARINFFFYNCIVSLGFLPWEENLGCFPLGKPAATESRYPTYGACWVFSVSPHGLRDL